MEVNRTAGRNGQQFISEIQSNKLIRYVRRKNMELKLVKGSYEYKEQIIDMLKEWIDYNDNHP